MQPLDDILQRAAAGDATAAAELLPRVYDELRRLAAAMLAAEKPGQTLQPTALVHEAYLRLVGRPVLADAGGGRESADEQPPTFSSRTHFFAAAAEAMRRILVDQARRKAAHKHGGSLARQELNDSELATAAPPAEVLAVHDALDRLAAEDPLTADLVKLHYFGGFSVEEAGNHLGLSRATAYRLWSFGKAWLRTALEDADGNRY
jgi:RNA polymerase sigma factor (sigma-70 family)